MKAINYIDHVKEKERIRKDPIQRTSYLHKLLILILSLLAFLHTNL